MFRRLLASFLLPQRAVKRPAPPSIDPTPPPPARSRKRPLLPLVRPASPAPCRDTRRRAGHRAARSIVAVVRPGRSQIRWPYSDPPPLCRYFGASKQEVKRPQRNRVPVLGSPLASPSSSLTTLRQSLAKSASAQRCLRVVGVRQDLPLASAQPLVWSGPGSIYEQRMFAITGVTNGTNRSRSNGQRKRHRARPGSRANSGTRQRCLGTDHSHHAPPQRASSWGDGPSRRDRAGVGTTRA